MNMFKGTEARSVEEYIEMIEEPRRSEVRRIHEFIVKTVPHLEPYLQGGMIGYGKRPYKSKSGREGEWFVVGLANNKNYVSIYSCAVENGEYLAERYKDKLGKVSVGKSCMRYKKIEDIVWEVLGEVLRESARIDHEVGIFDGY